jgi:hypothetical protein
MIFRAEGKIIRKCDDTAPASRYISSRMNTTSPEETHLT